MGDKEEWIGRGGKDLKVDCIFASARPHTKINDLVS